MTARALSIGWDAETGLIRIAVHGVATLLTPAEAEAAIAALSGSIKVAEAANVGRRPGARWE